MFGYVLPNDVEMTESEKSLYRSYYCGLCRTLSRKYGLKGQLSLSFDMTFLVLLLTAVYGGKEERGSLRCVPHPFKEHEYVVNRFTEYAAEMNVLLAYYKLRDDEHDDGNKLSAALANRLRPSVSAVCERYSRQADAVRSSLQALRQIEKQGELSPDKAADAFCGMTRELFVYEEDDNAPVFREIGTKLGSFIYLCDAVVDLKKDIRRERYNPLVAMPEASFEPMLTAMMSDCVTAYDRLTVDPAWSGILKNVLYSGVWTAFRAKQKKGEPK